MSNALFDKSQFSCNATSCFSAGDLHCTSWCTAMHSRSKYTQLRCTALGCSVICTPLHYTGPAYTVPYTLRCTALHYTKHNCTKLLECISLHLNALHFTALHWIKLHCTALHCTIPYLTALNFFSFHSATLHFTALQYTALPYTFWYMEHSFSILCSLLLTGHAPIAATAARLLLLTPCVTWQPVARLFTTKEAKTFSLLGGPLHTHFWEDHYIRSTGKATKSALLGRPTHPHYWEGQLILTTVKANKSWLLVRPIHPHFWEGHYLLNTG